MMHTNDACQVDRLAAENMDLRTERDRLAEALGKIADKAKYLSEPAWDREGCAFVGATIYRWASEALQGKDTSA